MVAQDMTWGSELVGNLPEHGDSMFLSTIPRYSLLVGRLPEALCHKLHSKLQA